MHTMRRIAVSLGRCHRYALYFGVDVLTLMHEVSPRTQRDHHVWFATAKLNGGKVFCRALNVDVDGSGQWRIRDESAASGSRRPVDDIYTAFAEWLESVEGDLRTAAVASPFPFFVSTNYPPKDT